MKFTEPFLINPRKRRHKGRKTHGGKVHRPRAYEEHGHWFTSRKAKKVRKHLKLNPFGEEVMIVGANPKRRKHRRHRRNPVGVLNFNSRRHHKRRRDHYRHNPDMLGGIESAGGVNWVQNLAPAAVVASGLLAAQTIPYVISSRGWIAADATWKVYGMRIGVGILGAMAFEKFGKRQYAVYWGVGVLTSIVGELLAQYVLPQIMAMISPAVAPATTTATTTTTTPGAAGIGAYPNEIRARGMRGVGAIPSQVRGGGSPYDTAGVYPY